MTARAHYRTIERVAPPAEGRRLRFGVRPRPLTMTFDDLLLDPAPTIGDAARRDWRWYAPVWAFPVVALLVLTAERAGAVPEWVTTVTLFGSFILGNLVSSVLVLIERATRRQYVVLGQLVPFAVWTVGVFARIGLLAALGRLDLV